MMSRSEDVRRIDETLVRDDVMDVEEADLIAEAIATGKDAQIIAWLEDTLECDGTNTEAKLAAILRGVIRTLTEVILPRRP